jgi:hypothetical protein
MVEVVNATACPQIKSHSKANKINPKLYRKTHRKMGGGGGASSPGEVCVELHNGMGETVDSSRRVQNDDRINLRITQRYSKPPSINSDK